jgi:hypothetical protein
VALAHPRQAKVLLLVMLAWLMSPLALSAVAHRGPLWALLVDALLLVGALVLASEMQRGKVLRLLALVQLVAAVVADALLSLVPLLLPLVEHLVVVACPEVNILLVRLHKLVVIVPLLAAQLKKV